MKEDQATTTRTTFDDFEHDVGDRVTVDSRRMAGPHTGTIGNLRKLSTARQYLVDLDDAGRTWFDEHEVDGGA